MLKEYTHVRQIQGESQRRWFSDDYFDLIVWLDDDTTIVGFQLCYDVAKTQRAVTWQQGKGFTHHKIDDGENRPGKVKASPVLVPDGLFDSSTIAARFEAAAQEIDPAIADFVLEILRTYPASHL